MSNSKNTFDKTNIFIAIGVYIVAFIVYTMTVQESLSFWDCGEFIACSVILGIPHPPGTPLFVIIGHIFSKIPFVADVSFRINMLTVICSAFTAMFSYLLSVKIINYFVKEENRTGLTRFITYIGGIAGAFFVAFSRTNWGNSVEAEVYGMALAMTVMLVWLTLIYFENRFTRKGTKILVFFFFLASLGISVHMTVFLVVPVCAIFFLLNRNAVQRDWLIVCGYILVELLMIILFSNIPNAVTIYKFISIVFAAIVFILLYKKINWAILIATASVSAVMISFSLYFKILPIVIPVLIILGIISKKKRLDLQWKTALAIVIVSLIGLSVHLYIPIRSELNPRIDENNPSRDWRTFVNYLDRKQYGQESMVDRMFHRRGTWENQFWRHPHMGYWSYFEDQYSKGGWNFIIPFFLLGMIGMIVAIRKRLEIGLPFFTLFIVCSVGLILYMNFADGTMYDPRTTDAYLEVRDRDYFFTPAFVFFGIAIGLGIAAVMMYIRDKLATSSPGTQKLGVYASAIMVLLPIVSLAHNYHANDRSHNFIPYNYATNILDSCDKDAILFTSGDNDTFPLWCVQEAYNYRKDVTVVNLSLLNTDWYVEQMKNRYHVPISLTDEQILWYPYEQEGGYVQQRPKKMFLDRPRKRRTFLSPSFYGGRIVKVQDMMVDDIVLENNWKRPIYFSSPPYAESPLNLRSRAVAIGLVYKLERNPKPNLIDTDKGFDLYMHTYRFGGYENSKVYRDENATGVFIGVGVNGIRIYDDLIKQGDTTRAIEIADKLIDSYPEYWQTYILLSDIYMKRGDTTKAHDLMVQLKDTLTSFSESNPENLFYKQDLGLAKIELGQQDNDLAMQEAGLSLLWEAFRANPNNSYGFRKLITSLSQMGKPMEMRKAAEMFGEYKINQADPVYQQIMGIRGGQ